MLLRTQKMLWPDWVRKLSTSFSTRNGQITFKMEAQTAGGGRGGGASSKRSLCWKNRKRRSKHLTKRRPSRRSEALATLQSPTPSMLNRLRNWSGISTQPSLRTSRIVRTPIRSSTGCSRLIRQRRKDMRRSLAQIVTTSMLSSRMLSNKLRQSRRKGKLNWTNNAVRRCNFRRWRKRKRLSALRKKN